MAPKPICFGSSDKWTRSRARVRARARARRCPRARAGTVRSEAARPSGCRMPFQPQNTQNPLEQAAFLQSRCPNARGRADLPLRLPCQQAGPPGVLEASALRTCVHRAPLASRCPEPLGARCPASFTEPPTGRSTVRSSTSFPESPRSPCPRHSPSPGMGRDTRIQSAAAARMGSGHAVQARSVSPNDPGTPRPDPVRAFFRPRAPLLVS
jgi:hypothetical protein